MSTGRIAFLGDINGAPGRMVLEQQLPTLRERYGPLRIVANAENARNGSGLTPDLYETFRKFGIDAMTLGDHVYRDARIVPILEDPTKPIGRPANLSARAQGKRIVRIPASEGFARDLYVFTLLGRVLMPSILANDPFACADEMLAAIPERNPLVLVEAHTRELLTTAPYPSRLPEENLADLSAQFAALAYGARNIAALAIELGREGFATRAEAELVSSHKRLARAIARSDIPPFHTPRRVSHQLDDGTPIALALGTLPDGRLRIDFNGSGAVHPRNFNAPLCVTRAAVLYALRLFVDEPVPMNEGLLRAVDLCVPEGVLNPPFSSDPALCPPVVAGNVETSQQVVAAMIDALALSAQSQTTMNNVLFGSPTFGVYETIGGGAGAGATHRGADAVHVHMSNTRLTDIDVLERRAPVVIRRHAVRANSGGAGLHRGGDGIVRSYEFLAPVELSFFGSMRTQSPQGKHGGLDGCAGPVFVPLLP